MLDDVDASLAAFVVTLMGGKLTARFEPPTAADGNGDGGKAKPAVHVVLRDVRRVIDGMSTDRVDVRDGDGRVVARRATPVRMQCTYGVSVSGPVAEAHRLLGRLLVGSLDHDALADEHRRGALADAPGPIELEVAPPDAGGGGGALAVTVRVTVPVEPTPTTAIAPPVEELEMGIERVDASSPSPTSLASETASSASPPAGAADRRWTTYRIRER